MEGWETDSESGICYLLCRTSGEKLGLPLAMWTGEKGIGWRETMRARVWQEVPWALAGIYTHCSCHRSPDSAPEPPE